MAIKGQSSRKRPAVVADSRNLRRRQRDETRQRLLEVSLELFVHKGYAGTTVRDIAAASGVSPGLMFHYFSSKEAILLEHVRTVRAGIEAMARRLNSRSDPLASFASVAEEILTSLRQNYSRNLFLLSNQILSFESIPQAARRLVSSTRSIEASVPLIARGQRMGQIRAGEPLALAVAFWGALQGIAEVLVWNPKALIPAPELVVALLRA